MRMPRPAALTLVVVLAGCSGGGGGGGNGAPSAPDPGLYTDPVSYSSAASASLAGAQEISAVTRHQLAIGGTTLDYTATAGHLTAASPGDGTPEASFFYVAYTLDGADPATRPVTFFYNGGPGSATAWLHLGSFGPRRLAVNAPSTSTPAPFAFVDNAESLLDKTDLVFVDAVGTGFSEAIAPNANRTFWGVDADAAVFRDFIVRYLAVNGRSASPRFLFGESYGTTRSAVLASLLESAGLRLAGVVLQSSVLDYNANCGIFEKPTMSCAGYLPSYGAVGAWHGLVQPPQPVAQLPAYMVQMRAVASGPYDAAVRDFLASRTAPAPSLASQLATQTGLGAADWNAHFNMDPGYFHANLIPGSVIGLYDGRMAAALGTPLAAQGDPSTTFYDGAFASTIVSYLRDDLHYTTPSSYVMLGNQINVWNFAHGGRTFPDTIPDLGAALAIDPSLRVFSANGYHDMVTPFFQTENDLARLAAPQAITIGHYQGGHMTYLDDTARTAEKADLAAFYATATGKAVTSAVPSPPAVAARETPASRGNMPPAIFETRVRDPAIPESMRGLSPQPPTAGRALREQVEERLRAPFDAASAGSRGLLTREKAGAAGLGYIARNFEGIDAGHRGAVSFEDVKRFLRERGARLPE